MMLNAVTTKLELDVMVQAELEPAMALAGVHTLPAIVVNPQLMLPAIQLRIRKKGHYKIMTTIDWPRGEMAGILKLRGMTSEMMHADGFEIMLTGGKNEADITTEAQLLTDFIRQNISAVAEIRFVLGYFGRERAEVSRICRALTTVTLPSLIRTDTHLKVQATRANAKAHIATLEHLKTYASIPIKLAGNIDSIKVIAACLKKPNSASYFAINLQQLQAIINDLEKQPDELRQLLETPA